MSGNTDCSTLVPFIYRIVRDFNDRVQNRTSCTQESWIYILELLTMVCFAHGLDVSLRVSYALGSIMALFVKKEDTIIF
jgi:hypothetical protein